MACELLVVEATSMRVARGLVELYNAVLQVEVDEAVEVDVGRPFDKTWLWTIHDGE